MSTPSVKTVQFVDPRIEPQPDPAYEYIIGPTQNQFYKIPASGKGNSSITFNNLTTLGADRAYLDTFEIELTADIYFVPSRDWVDDGTGKIERTGPRITWDGNTCDFPMLPSDWTFDSFPFSKCCSKITANINGGAFFSQPMAYLRAKERYMDPESLARHYTNICPVAKPICQTESGKLYNTPGLLNYVKVMHAPSCIDSNGNLMQTPAVPTRLGVGMYNFNQTAQGMKGGFNNAIVRLGERLTGVNEKYGYENYHFCKAVGDPSVATDDQCEALYVHVTWREPVLCSPFSARYDADYQRPLYNITSMDLTFEMPTLGNMIRIANLNGSAKFIENYVIDITAAELCYQVMTIPPSVTKPLQTIVPYRRFVPYVTDFPKVANSATGSSTITADGGVVKDVLSGVYTLNEMPTAIWVFCGPSMSTLQQNDADVCVFPQNNPMVTNQYGNWDSNKLFAYIRRISISMANTTQILERCQPYDLYRMAIANGCYDSYWSWQQNDSIMPKQIGSSRPVPTTITAADSKPVVSFDEVEPMYYGAGSVLRLIPGVDLIVPDQQLIPGANANNMVFQCRADFYIPPHAANLNNYSLWLLFEYVGVASISPGQCEITMNPLGSGEIMNVSPIMSATTENGEGAASGSGFWDRARRGAEIASHIAKEGVLSRILKNIPGMEAAAAKLASMGYGEPSCKKRRGGAVRGGAVMGLDEWM